MSSAIIEREKDAPSASTDTVSHWPQLDGYRGLGLLMIFVIHAWSHEGIKPSPMGVLGYLGVDCFFTLSAFLITSLLLREKCERGSIDYRAFFARRCLRIWPLTYCVIAFAALLPLLNATVALPLYGEFFQKQILPSALFYFNFVLAVNIQSVNHFSYAIGIPVQSFILPIWTLCIEEHFYAVWPFVLKQASSLKKLLIAICGLEVFTISARCFGHWASFNLIDVPTPFQLYFMNTFCHLDPLLAGAFLAVIYRMKPASFECTNKVGGFLSVVFCAVLTYLLTNVYLHFPISSPFLIVDLIMTALAAGLMLYLIMAWKPVRVAISNRVLIEIGKVSFAIYLFHGFILALLDDAFMRLGVPNDPFVFLALKLAVGFPASYLLAKLSWKFIERPCLNLKRKFQRVSVNAA